MRRPLVLLLTALLLVSTFTVTAQNTRRLNPQDPLDIAVYCSGANIDIYHITPAGSGQPALFASQAQVNGALLAARDGGGAVAVATGDFGVTLTALPGIRLRATQSFEGRVPYAFEFAGDACGPVNLPPPLVTVTDGNAAGAAATASTTVSGATNTTTTTTGTIDYTVARGDSWYRIARRFNVSVDELAAANGTIISDIIYPGQVLRVPNQVVEAPAASSGGAAPAADPGTPQLTVDAAGNYLQDPSFEGIYTGRGAADFNIPGAWGIQVFTSPREYEWQNLRPFAFPRRDQPIRSGSFSLNINRGYATFSVVLFQRVAVPENANVTASAWAFYDTCDAGRSSCDNGGNPNFRVGIDPNGGTSPFDSDIVWAAFIAPQGGWGQSSTSTQAQGNVVTMYISASQERPRAINELYIDDAALTAN